MDEKDKFNKYNLGDITSNRSIKDTQWKIDELMNDEELKEAFRKMKGDGDSKEDYVAPDISAQERSNVKNNDNGYTIEQLMDKDCANMYPVELRRLDLELIYIGLLLNNPAAISMYYFVASMCLFADKRMINIYKGILFTEGEAYAPAIAKENFNFATEGDDVYALKKELKRAVLKENYSFEKVYTELKKIFILRKSYNGIPIAEIKEKVAAITKYELYDSMTPDEVEAAIEQITATAKFKSSVLNSGVTNFLVKGDNSLTNGLNLPFKIINSVFKGVRKGETMAFAMPSNTGKSRFTTFLAAYIAFIHRKKVLIISNEMSEEKIKLCLITTIINNPEIQKLHGQKIRKTENQILECKYRPDNPGDVKVDEEGFVLKEPGETQEQFVQRLTRVSTEFNQVTAATDWLDKEIENSIYFINITDHTNDELKKVITNYYYRYKIEYMFYDTLKTDTANIGNGEEIKKTATILSNLAQNLGIFICSSLQLTETSTPPINLTINDLAVSRTVKEVLDTLLLVKQIQRENLEDYEYSENEVAEKGLPLEKFSDPDVRYYAFVVDKNRAGPKPKVVFRLNLAYNEWNELGYLRLKEKKF